VSYATVTVSETQKYAEVKRLSTQPVLAESSAISPEPQDKHLPPPSLNSPLSKVLRQQRMYHFSFLPIINTPSLTVQDFQYQTLYRIRCRFSDVSKQKYLFLDCLTSHDEYTTLPRPQINSPTTQRHIPTAHRHSATSQHLTNDTLPHTNRNESSATSL